MKLWSGRQEGMPYSLSRYTDVPAAKWDWFRTQLAEGSMVAFDPRMAIPGRWSLKPEDVLGLIFWTKDPANLIQDVRLIRPYKKVVHMTVTGWTEVEQGAPDMAKGLDLLASLVDHYGPQNVVLRFSPVPIVPDVIDRFVRIAGAAVANGLTDVYVSFLQPNDRMPETRSIAERRDLLKMMADTVPDIDVNLCQDDKLLDGFEYGREHWYTNLQYGVCESGRRFKIPSDASREDCGCCFAVDPFTANEACSLGCAYCYSAKQDVSLQKIDTTKGVP
jgi:DNA repair photolyase